jgi:hypothetical protein
MEEAMRLLQTSVVAVLALAAMAACDRDYTFEPPPYEAALQQIAHTFQYIPHDDTPEITSIVVRGGFNDWSGDAITMTYHDGVWSATVPFDAGATYEYKFVINGNWPTDMCNDPTWGHPDHDYFIDIAAAGCAEDGHGGQNAILIVDPDGLPAHTFRYTPHETTEEISKIVVRGQFNGWEGDAMAMTLWEGVWRVTAGLEPDTYEYKYVFNGDQWAGNMCAEDRWGNPPGGPVDPDNDNCVEDGQNAILEH